MIKRILRLMLEGRSGYGEMSAELGITEAQLENRLETMARMGYIEEEQPSDVSCGEAKFCMGCAYAKKGDKDGCSDSSLRSYFLTNKGRAFLERTSS